MRANTGEQPHQRVGSPVYIVNSVGIAGTALSVGEKFFSNTYNIVHGLFTGTSIWNHSVWTIVILSSIRKVFWDIAFTGYIAHLFFSFFFLFQIGHARKPVTISLDGRTLV